MSSSAQHPLSSKPCVQSVTRGFAQWLYKEQLTLFVSTYQHDCLILLSAEGSEEVKLSAYPFDRPMGLAVSQTELRLATRQHIWEFQNTTSILTSGEGVENSIYQLKTVTPTGFLDAHDLVSGRHGESILVDTHHSCLRRVTSDKGPEPIWSPAFITDLVPEDRCHLNGLASENGTPRFATVVSQSNDAEGWRRERREGGALIDIETNEIVAKNLSMPHSPRIHRDQIWILNAGTGEFGFIEPSDGTFQAIAFCPGFLRGLAFHNEFAIIGLSQARHNRKFTDLELADTLDHRNEEAICGLMVINIETHEVWGTLEFSEPITELFDIQAQTSIGHPTLLKCRQLE